MSSYVETVCHLFDDSGFSFAVENNQAVGFLGQELTETFLIIDSLTQQINHYATVEEVVNLSVMEEIRGIAAITLILVDEKAKLLIYRDGQYWQRSY